MIFAGTRPAWCMPRGNHGYPVDLPASCWTQTYGTKCVATSRGSGRVIDADTSKDVSIENMAARAISALSGPAIIVGFSMGGYVAREIVYQAPERVKGLALVATSSLGDDPARVRTPVEATGFRQLSRASVARSLHPDHRSKELIARVQQMSHRLGGTVFSQQSRMTRQEDTGRLGEIRCPTLIVAGAQLRMSCGPLRRAER